MKALRLFLPAVAFTLFTGCVPVPYPETPPQSVASSAAEKAVEMETSDPASLLPVMNLSDWEKMPPGAAFDGEFKGNGDPIFYADVDHDGAQECILLRLRAYDGANGSVAEVHQDESPDSPVIWSRDFGTAHAGWVSLYLYKEAGKDYILEYTPSMYQGYGSYQLQIYSLDEEGNQQPFFEENADFSMQKEEADGYHNGIYGDVQGLIYFLETAHERISKSMLLVTTEQGNFAYSTPEEPITLYPDQSSLFQDWDVLKEGEMDVQLLSRMAEKNWTESEGIPLLLAHADSAEVRVKSESRLEPAVDALQNALFDTLKEGSAEEEWKLISRERQPMEALASGGPDVLMILYRNQAPACYLSCYREEEKAVVWTAPFVYDGENQMRWLSEVYSLSSEAMGEVLEACQ